MNEMLPWLLCGVFLFYLEDSITLWDGKLPAELFYQIIPLSCDRVAFSRLHCVFLRSEESRDFFLFSLPFH